MTQQSIPARWQLCDAVAELRAKLQRLEETGDPASPTIADLKRIVLQRIAEIELSEEVTASES